MPVTSCDQVKRKICAEDHCRVVEGEEECHDKVVASAVEVPEETCSMAPEEECKNVTTSVPQVPARNLLHPLYSAPQLLPEQECRLIPKEVCQTVFLNPRNVKVRKLGRRWSVTHKSVSGLAYMQWQEVPLSSNMWIPTGNGASEVLHQPRHWGRPAAGSGGLLFEINSF